METLLIIIAIFVALKIFVPYAVAVLQFFLTPAILLLKVIWEMKWVLLAGIVILIILSALGVFA